jgi:hypothetical protein
MNFLALNDDVKFIISNHLASDLKIRALISKIMTFKKYYLETSCIIRMCVCMYVYTYVFMYVCMYMYVYLYTYTYIGMYIRMYVCMYVCMYVK